MKLNHDCVRALLLYLEENLTLNAKINFLNIRIDGFDSDTIIYTTMKLTEAGYIESRIRTDTTETVFGNISGITWEGHKFLDTIRDNQVWSQTKKILSKVSSSSISFVSTIASQVLTNLINQYMGTPTQPQH
ncbi:MAG: DUF2513 domain-containing protein [Clostridiales bacterium]|nr:DUF2513 domain-containing protein [Clostridiales bacterium]MBD8948254.1 DUF2513 domain-containing protein [Clostridiales bacterium]